jgi:hypothetical protein
VALQLHLGALLKNCKEIDCLVTSRGEFEDASNKLDESETILGVQARSQWAPQIAVEHCGKNNIFSGHAAGASGDYRYYLSFNDYQN